MNELRALDKEVAERIMGWTNLIEDASTPYGKDLCGTDPIRTGGWDGFGRKAVPRYASDLAAAYEVISRMDRGVRIMKTSRATWTCEFHDGKDYNYLEDAGDMAEAICRSALEAVKSISS